MSFGAAAPRPCTDAQGAPYLSPDALTTSRRPGPRKPRPLVREVRVELQGQLRSALFQTLMECLRLYRHRYAPLMRCYFTAVDGPRETLAGLSTDAPPVVTGVASHACVSHENDDNSWMSGRVTFDRNTAMEAFCDGNNDTPVALEGFMKHFFLSAAVHRTWEDAQSAAATVSDDPRGEATRSPSSAFAHVRKWVQESAVIEREDSKASGSGGDTASTPLHGLLEPSFHGEWPLYLRHYLEEGSRTASFLIANKKTRRAVVVDPDWVVSRIDADLDRFQLTLVAIALTHCYLDVRTGHAELLRRHPSAELVWYGSFAMPAQRREPRRQEVLPFVRLAESHNNNNNNGDDEDGSHHPDGGDVLSLPVRLGDGFFFIGRWTPIATFDSVTFELWFERHLDSAEWSSRERLMRLCIFGGISFSLDGLPRSDLWDVTRSAATSTTTAETTAPIAAASSVEDLSVANRWQEKLPPEISTASRRRFGAMRRWFVEYFGGTFDSVVQKDSAIVFSSHGGYSHMTHQLDQHWAAHIADLKRFTHVKKLLEHLLVPPAETSVALSNGPTPHHESERAASALQSLDASLPPLPIGGLFFANRARNMDEAVRRGTSLTCTLPSLPSMPSSTERCSGVAFTAAADEGFLFPSGAMIIDVRPITEFIKSHWRGSINVPMTFPSTVRRTRKAELWLECLLPPFTVGGGGDESAALSRDASHRRRIVVVIGSTDCDAQAVRQRFERIGCEHIDVRIWNPRNPVGVVVDAQTTSWRRLSDTPSLRLLETSGDDDKESTSGSSGSSNECRHRSQRNAAASSTSLVVDVRTHYEFKNGSHRASVHIPLSDLCAWYRDSFALAPLERAIALMNHLRDEAMKSGILPFRRADLRQIVLYCAAGYRSHIAVSIIHSVLDAARGPLGPNDEAPLEENGGSHPSCWQFEKIEVLDVAGGALQIMLHRPDVWVVKDRSIVCIS